MGYMLQIISSLILRCSFTILVAIIVQDDGRELLRACISEQWDVAEALINSGGMLEAQDKVINVTVFRLSKYLKTSCNNYVSETYFLAS